MQARSEPGAERSSLPQAQPHILYSTEHGCIRPSDRSAEGRARPTARTWPTTPVRTRPAGRACFSSACVSRSCTRWRMYSCMGGRRLRRAPGRSGGRAAYAALSSSSVCRASRLRLFFSFIITCARAARQQARAASPRAACASYPVQAPCCPGAPQQRRRRKQQQPLLHNCLPLAIC